MSNLIKGKADYLALGDWNAVCFECGRKFKASQLLRNWQGYWVCSKHWEPRHPQDFVRAIPDIQTPPWVQPMQADIFITTKEALFAESSHELTGDFDYILSEDRQRLFTEE